MPLILSLAMIVPGAVCVACAATTRPRVSRTAVLGAVAMLAAMVAMAAGALVTPIVWAAALVGIALCEAVARRLRTGRRATGHAAFDGHRPIGIVVTAGLIAGSAAGPVAASSHAHGPSGGLLPLAAAAYVLILLVWLIRHRRALPPRHSAEGVSMAVMIGAMLLAPLAA